MGKKSSRESKTSSGKHKVALRKRALRKIRQKIARWDRYREEEKSPVSADQKEKKNFSPKSRHRNWDTTGLKKQLELLEALV